RAIHGGKNKNDRIDSEKLAHLLRSNLIPPAYVYPAQQRPLRALLRQRIFYVWRRAQLLARIHCHQLAHNRIPAKQSRWTRDDFLSYCRLVKGTVASAGKIKGLRGAKLSNPYLRWAFGEAAVIAKRDHFRIRPLAQQLEARMEGNKFKANTVVAIKLARAVYFMLKNQTVCDPDRLVSALSRN